jgi:23S rRNA (guanosine2251-2'-O)-methyltransferase
MTPPRERRDRTRDRIALGGRRAVLEAVRAGLVSEILMDVRARSTPGLRDLASAAGAARVPVRTVAREDLDRSGAAGHQGVVAFVVPPPPIDERALAGLRLGGDEVLVVLDGVEDPQNLGACARAAEAAGASALVLRRRRSAPLTPAAIRASAGALLHLPVARVANLRRAIDRLKDRGVFVVGLDHRAAATIHDAPPARPLALVVGAEGAGISRLVREGCDLLVAIPMRGRTGSLNASAALAVALFAYVARPEQHP